MQELGETMTAAEFGIWWAEYRREPWGDFRTDLGAGLVAATLANVNRDAKSKPVPFSALDFMPFAREPEPPAAETDPVEFFNALGVA